MSEDRTNRHQRLEQAEKILHALWDHQVDAIIGEHCVMLLHPQEAEKPVNDPALGEPIKDLVQHPQKIQEWLGELTQAEQRERERIARELHDYLAQLLVLCRLKVQHLSTTTPEVKISQLTKEVDQLLDQATTYTRTLMAELNPQVLYHQGLPQALTWLSEQMTFHGLEVDLHLETEIFTLTSLPEEAAILLYQSVRELLFNVIKHAGVLKASVKLAVEEGPQLMMSVTDTGKGFDPYASLSRPTRSAHFGILNIQQRLKALFGQLAIDSVPGKGTCATITLPLQSIETSFPPRPAPSRLKEKSTAPPSPIRVMLVDDHHMVRAGLRSLLEQHPDLEVVGEAANGQEAIQLAHELTPEVIVMDVRMPKVDGIAATRRILPDLPETIIIGLSTDTDSREAMIQAGAVTHLQKDQAPSCLYQAIYNYHPHRKHRRAGQVDPSHWAKNL